MSHYEGHSEKDAYYIDPKEVLSQYSVEWIALRKSYEEVKRELEVVKGELSDLDKRLQNGDISEEEHLAQYHEKWLISTQMIQIKREVEARLYEIQKEIRDVSKKLKQQDEERERQERLEQEKSNAMIEWMSLKQGFDLVGERRRDISSQMDKLELQRRSRSINDAEYRKRKLVLIGQLAELSTVESDVKSRLAELLEIIRK